MMLASGQAVWPFCPLCSRIVSAEPVAEFAGQVGTFVQTPAYAEARRETVGGQKEGSKSLNPANT
jgi:hypothetical protein